jgi:hypothetical protein
MIPSDVHLQIGSLLFEGLDQIDLTGPVRGSVTDSQFDLSPLWQDGPLGPRCQGLATDT